MSVKQILQIESNVATDRPIKIPFDFSRKEMLPEGKKLGDSIVITPITVRTWFRIKPLLMYIEKQDRETLTANKDTGFNNEIADLIAKYDDIIFDIVCLGIHNKRGDMPVWFREVLKDNCTWEDIYILLNAILFRIGCNPFSCTITALEAVSPLGEEELIALQKNSESWKNRNPKVASCS